MTNTTQSRINDHYIHCGKKPQQRIIVFDNHRASRVNAELYHNGGFAAQPLGRLHAPF